jgi:glycosyltransferase involved in cell wall biosynthesis
MVLPGDSQQLYEALDRLMLDASLAKRLGQASLRTVQKRYAAEIVTRQYIDLFRSCTIVKNSVSKRPASEAVDPDISL